MTDWFNSLEPSLKIYWGTAIIASMIFVVQTIISFVGGDIFDDVDLDANHDTDGISHFFSVRNLVNFLLGAGWGGVCFYHLLPNKTLLMVVAVISGTVFVLIFFGLVKILLKLNQDNTFCISETLNKVANVYLSIPENRRGKGKIQISVRGSLHELEAVTEAEKIPTGAKVRVAEIVDEQTVRVENI
jgi:hypothetical protein